MEKMLTFEEWEKGWSGRSPIGDFEAARIGTIPAENAVVIPDVSEWPEDGYGRSATAFVVTGFFTWAASKERQIEELDKSIDEKFISWIPRPKPVLVPKVGEAVFVNWGSSTVVCRYLGLDDGQEMVIAPNGDTTMIYPKERKPFHESHIGKSWSEIPGGVE